MSPEYIKATLELISLDDKLESSADSPKLNPSFVWARFVLTDDKPNKNKMRIPKEEFASLISTGLYTPVKMSLGGPDGHDTATPIGVITHLREVSTEDSNKIIGLAALWSEERKDDIKILKERFSKKRPLDISWEVYPGDTSEDENGIKNIIKPVLSAVAVVRVPAYDGRTPIDELFAYASEINNVEEDTLDEKQFEALKSSLAETFKSALEEKDSKITELSEKLESLESEVKTLSENQITEEIKTELDELREFKTTKDAEAELAEKKEEIRKEFEEAGLEIEEEYLEANEKVLLAMEVEEREFFINTLKEAKKGKETSSVKVPNLRVEEGAKSSSEIGRLLRETKFNKS